MWQKKKSKLELVASMVLQMMPELSRKRNVIILCSRWYMKKNLVSIVDEYPSLDLIENTRSDSLIYNLPPAPTWKKGSPAKHGRHLSTETDCVLSDKNTDDYCTGFRRVLTNIFGARNVMAYVTCASSEGKSDPEPHGKQLDAVYLTVPILVSMEYQNKLL